MLSGLVISLVLGSVPNGVGTMVLQVFCFSKSRPFDGADRESSDSLQSRKSHEEISSRLNEQGTSTGPYSLGVGGRLIYALSAEAFQ